MTPLLQPSQESSSRSKPEIDDPWKNGGYQFIPVRRAHLDYLVAVYGREHPDLSRVFGRTLVDRNFIPLGMCLIYFAADGTHEIHAHYGSWFRKFPKQILDGMRPICRKARDAGIRYVYAIADEAIPGSVDLVRYFEGENTGARSEHPPIGDVYKLDFHGHKFTQWLNQRDRGYGYDPDNYV